MYFKSLFDKVGAPVIINSYSSYSIHLEALQGFHDGTSAHVIRMTLRKSEACRQCQAPGHGLHRLQKKQEINNLRRKTDTHRDWSREIFRFSPDLI